MEIEILLKDEFEIICSECASPLDAWLWEMDNQIVVNPCKHCFEGKKIKKEKE